METKNIHQKGSVLFSKLCTLCIFFFPVMLLAQGKDTTSSEKSKNLEDVVVIGYGSTKSKDLTAAISTVKADELSKTSTSAAMAGLQGRVAGVQIVTKGGLNTAPEVRIRGLGSYGDQSPLYVVDGMLFNDINFLNTSDIKSISILKDASAAAIYGVRAANGVVLVETKGGGFNQPTQITYEGKGSIMTAVNLLKMANAEQYATAAIASEDVGAAAIVTNSMQKYGRSLENPNVPTSNTNWYKEALKTGYIQAHSVSVSGGTSKISLLLNGSFTGGEDIVGTTDYKRFNIRGKFDFKATDWLMVGTNLMLGQQRFVHNVSENFFRSLYTTPALLPVKDPSNSSGYAYAGDIGLSSFFSNPLATLPYTFNISENRRLVALTYAQINLFNKKLTLKTTLNQDLGYFRDATFTKSFYVGENQQNNVSDLGKSSTEFENVIWDNVLTYQNQFGKHNLTLMAGTSFRDEGYQSIYGNAENVPEDKPQSWYLAQAKVRRADGYGDDGVRNYGSSYFGRVAYNYLDRYIFYATVRADGTSKYQVKWGTFPSIGAGWVISGENFMKNVKFVDYLKLRGGWGKLGNDKIPASSGFSSVDATDQNRPVYGSTWANGYTVTNFFSYLDWEVVSSTNIGLSAKLFKERLSIEADYFHRVTENAVISPPIPNATQTIMRNAAQLTNSGFEMTADWRQDINKDWSFGVGGNIFILKNSVSDLKGLSYLDDGSAEFRQRSILDGTLKAFYGYEVIGVYQNQTEINNDPIAVKNKLEPGDLKYRDLNNDGDITDGADRKVIGSYFSDFDWGFHFDVTYKQRLSLSMVLQGRTGNKILNKKLGWLHKHNNLNIHADLAKGYWSGEGTSNTTMSAKGIRKPWNQKMSTFYVEDGSYFNVENIQLSYRIPAKKKDDKTVFPEIGISFIMENPISIFNNHGFSPEVFDGIDENVFPDVATYSLSVKVVM